ncbi:MAG: UPF0301 protein [Micavibrio sp.]|nr:MAG: UPF0301 protein [Micavibrio sp.]
MPFKKLKITPRQARYYLFFAALLIALPSIANMYKGHEGKFLVATSAVEGSPFEETVIYLSHHNFWGARGVVINKPIRKAKVDHDFPEKKWYVHLYEGGPVNVEKENSLLLKAEELPQGFVVTPVDDARKAQPDLIEVFEKNQNKNPLRLFMGYSGWGVWQLNREIARGTWGVIDYDPSLMFRTKSTRVWKKAMERVSEEQPAKEAGA